MIGFQPQLWTPLATKLTEVFDVLFVAGEIAKGVVAERKEWFRNGGYTHPCKYPPQGTQTDPTIRIIVLFYILSIECVTVFYKHLFTYA